MTIVEFLTARLDEDEADWQVVAARDVVEMLHGKPLAPRMLAEVEAKRRIVDEHTPALRRPVDDINEDWCETCRDTSSHDGWPCTTIRLLALPYADHPDHDDEWRTAVS